MKSIDAVLTVVDIIFYKSANPELPLDDIIQDGLILKSKKLSISHFKRINPCKVIKDTRRVTSHLIHRKYV